jgi:hypothetical protein
VLRNILGGRAGSRSLWHISDLLAAKGRFCHGAGNGLDEHGHAVNEPGIRGGTLLREDCGGVGAKVRFILFKSVHRRLILENDQLAVGLATGLKSHRYLGQVSVTNVLTFLVYNTTATGPADDQPALLDLREKRESITLLGKGL